MKKVVKSLVIAASAVAVVGLGAVSYAKWNTDISDTAASDQQTLGSITVTGGFVKPNTDPEKLTTSDTNLVPYDQGSGTRKIEFAIPDYQLKSGEGYTLTLTATGESDTDLNSLFKYQITDNSVDIPADTTAFGTWGTAAGTAAVTKTAAEVTANATITGKKLTVILNSSSFDDMGKKVTFTLTYATV